MRFNFYKGAKELLTKYKARGLQILAVPLNEFDNTAPQSSACEKAKLYEGVGDKSFIVLDKLTSGAPFLQWLTSQEPPNGGPSGSLRTSYEKFLIDSSGSVVRRYGAFDDEWLTDVSGEIKRLLK